jgi:alpha-mannosidase/mannosylglycerate hydrolase
MPTNVKGDSYLSDSTFDVVERKIALAADNAIRKELDVETKPHFTWTAMADKEGGMAVVTRGLPEVAVSDTPERPIALTLLRAFRRAVLSNDNMGGQIQGTHVFRYDIEPFTGAAPRKKLCLQSQRIGSVVRQVDLLPAEIAHYKSTTMLPAEQSFLSVDGDVVVTSVQRQDGALAVRLFNPTATPSKAKVETPEGIKSIRSVTLEGKEDTATRAKLAGRAAEVTVPAKRIATLLIG